MTTYLFADSGSTKTEWALVSEGQPTARFTTSGMNPFLMGISRFRDVLHAELLPHICGIAIDEVHFYGAGCVDSVLQKVRSCFAALLPTARTIVVASDLQGACEATSAGHESLVAILGTGANSCLYDGTQIVARISSLGFILGDEGSGAALGKLFLNALLKKRLSAAVEEAFRAEYALCETDILDRVYHATQPNTFLASFAPFLRQHSADDSIQQIITSTFHLFFEHNIRPYHRRDLPIHCVGSIAHYFSTFLQQVARDEGYQLGTILRAPIEYFVAHCDQTV